MTDIVKRLMQDVPRGDSTRPLREQKVPQAQWMQVEDVAASRTLAYDPANPGRKLLVGAIGSRLIGIDDPRHAMQFAGTRSGKSLQVSANLMFYRGSALVLDPKGELAEQTAERREAMGQTVLVFDPYGCASPKLARFRATYNPMSILRLDSPTFLEDVEQISDAIVVMAPDAREPHWDESAMHFFDGVTTHTATFPDYRERRDLVTVRQLLSKALSPPPDDPEAPPMLYTEMLRNAESLIANPESEAIGQALLGATIEFYAKQGTERSGVYSSVMRHTKWLDLPCFQRILRGGDLDLASLKNDPGGITIYLIFPATRIDKAKRWLRLFINQLIDAMEREKTKPAVPVLVCLDEFVVLGYMKQLEMACGLIAGLDVKLWFMLQDWKQGSALYRERWETFVGNSGIIQVFGNNDDATTSYFSKYMGKTQVEVARLGEVAQDQQNKGLSGRSQEIVLYDLMTPDEIRRYFSRDDVLKRQLVLWAGHHPIMLQRVEWFDRNGPLANYLSER